MNQILTDEDIDSVWIEPGLDECDVRRFARAIESRVAAKLRKQILEEVCYKMASGSPNRARIHTVIKEWV